MNDLVPVTPTTPVSPLRQRLIDDMNTRHFSRETQRNYIRDVGRFATFLCRPPHMATAEDLRRKCIDQKMSYYEGRAIYERVIGGLPITMGNSRK